MSEVLEQAYVLSREAEHHACASYENKAVRVVPSPVGMHTSSDVKTTLLVVLACFQVVWKS